DVHVRRRRDQYRPVPARVGRAAGEHGRVALPGLHERVRYRFAGTVEHPPGQPDRPARILPLGEPDREERPDRLGRGRHGPSSNGVERSTRSNRYASAHSGTVASRSNPAISRPRAAAGTELKIGSWPKSGSPGKYICVTRRWANACPNSEKCRCAGRQALWWFCHGYAPGFTVTNRYRPPASVRQRPVPVKFGSSGAGWLSPSWRYRPAAFACHSSTSVPASGRPSVSTTRPCTTMRSPRGSPGWWAVRSASAGETVPPPNTGPVTPVRPRGSGTNARCGARRAGDREAG